MNIDKLIEQMEGLKYKFQVKDMPEYRYYNMAIKHCMELVKKAKEEAQSNSKSFDLVQYIIDQTEWSTKTFGHSCRTIGITKHIEKEIAEIRTAPHDLAEWIDVVILALEGAWRHGYSPWQIVDMLIYKQTINFNRTWPKDQSEDQPTEHLKAKEEDENKSSN